MNTDTAIIALAIIMIVSDIVLAFTLVSQQQKIERLENRIKLLFKI